MHLDAENDVKIDAESSTPPYSNRGAQNTERSGLRALVDWLSATFRNVQDYTEIIELLGLEKEQFREVESGKYGYKLHARLGHIAIYYDGGDGMGVFLDISGQGCREYESFGLYSWSELFVVMHSLKVKFTRLDIAIDDFNDMLSIPTLKRKVREGAVRSRFKSAVEIRKSKLSDGSSSGETLYFGSPSSRIQVRFYDKYLEQTSKNRKVDSDLLSWNRVELQLRKEHANAVATVIANHERSIGKCVLGILNNYVTFCVKSSKDTNKARWAVAKFWTDFLDGVDKLPLTQVAPDLSIERSQEWIRRQATATLAMLYTAYDGDMMSFMNYLIDGTNKMDEKHREIINRFRAQHGEAMLTKEQYHEILNQNVYDLVAYAKQTKKSPEIG